MASPPLLTLEGLLYEPLFDFAEPNWNIPDLEQDPICIDMPTPTSAHRSPLQSSAAAAAFIAEHTTTITDARNSDECPICMENYGPVATCLQIKNIEECTHRFCKSCVGALVDKHSGTDLRCPNCRASWIPGATTGTSLATRAPAREPNIHGRPGNREPLSAAARAFVPGGRVVINLEEEDDYDTQLRNFNQAAREIENVRARARGTHMSREQRRQEMEDETTRRRSAEREMRHLQDRSRINERMYGPRNRTPAQPTQATVVERPSIANNFNFPRSARSRDNLRLLGDVGVPSDRVRPVPGPATPPVVAASRENPAAQARTQLPTVNRNQAHDVQRENALDAREIALNKRATTLNDREKLLNDRATTLDRRATSLSVREDHLKKEEVRVNKRLTNALAKEKAAKTCVEQAEKMAQLAHKQRAEMEKLIKRQRHEMDKEFEKASMLQL